VQTGLGIIPPPPGSPVKREDSNNSSTQNRQKSVNQSGGTMSSCDDCGIVFENIHDLQNHVKRWCSERQSQKRLFPDEDVYPNKRLKYEESDKKYEEQGLYSSKAKTKANNALREDNVRSFMQNFAMLISYIFKVKQ
jgi:hypothetical protein